MATICRARPAASPSAPASPAAPAVRSFAPATRSGSSLAFSRRLHMRDETTSASQYETHGLCRRREGGRSAGTGEGGGDDNASAWARSPGWVGARVCLRICEPARLRARLHAQAPRTQRALLYTLGAAPPPPPSVVPKLVAFALDFLLLRKVVGSEKRTSKKCGHRRMSCARQRDSRADRQTKGRSAAARKTPQPPFLPLHTRRSSPARARVSSRALLRREASAGDLHREAGGASVPASLLSPPAWRCWRPGTRPARSSAAPELQSRRPWRSSRWQRFWPAQPAPRSHSAEQRR